MSEIAQNLKKIREEIPQHVKLIAVSKTKSVEDIREAMQAGQLAFGENKAQELTTKHEALPDAEWHYIGHLQTNKVKYMAPFVAMIQSVDSLRLLEEINKHAQKYSRVIDCLLQIHIALEETKSGLSDVEVVQLLEHPQLQDMKNIRICGLMGMATYTDDTNQIHKEFRGLMDLFQKIKHNYFSHNDAFKEISMGMSSDYHIAIEEGSTMVRIGSSIFGERNK